jgi:agmatine deiminase
MRCAALFVYLLWFPATLADAVDPLFPNPNPSPSPSLRFEHAEPWTEALPVRIALPHRDGERPSPLLLKREKQPRNKALCGPPGEFERQQAIMMAWQEEDDSICRVQLDMVRAVCETTTVAVIVPPDTELTDVELRFRNAGLTSDNVVFLRLPVDTAWVRDYGPWMIQRGQHPPLLIDAIYDSGRPDDDAFPTALAGVSGVRCEQTGLAVEGGNLLSNGDGLLVTSSKTIQDNLNLGYSLKETETKLLQIWNAQHLIVLEPLAGEPTSHVDMFVTIVNADTIVVAEMDRKEDDANARLLDQAVQRLCEYQTNNGTLVVERIPMPPQRDAAEWPTYTNVVYANGVLLLPYYYEKDTTWQRARAVYSRLLPDWKIVGIDCTDVIESGGALHCLTLNLPEPRVVTDRFRSRASFFVHQD